jgi:glycosyltransferase involved in cell wall biosynthesis
MSLPRLRIAQVAPPLEPIPPRAYGGTERVVGSLVEELHARGHEVTTVASGDSTVPGRLLPSVERALWPAGFGGDASPHFVATIETLLQHAHEFDLVHAHLEWYNPLVARLLGVPVIATFHGRLDLPWAPRLLAPAPCLPVGISRSQVSALPSVRWAAVVHNGLDLESMPFGRDRTGALCFVGRVAPEKGIVDAIQVALAAGRPLRIAAKVGTLPAERAYHESVFLPALRRAGRQVEYLGELGRHDRDRLFAESYATLMPGAWPEPFGLVAIESLACGTPVLARRTGALPEIVREGVDGFLGAGVTEMARMADGVAMLDRAAIRRSVLERFSAARMVDAYEAVYCRALDEQAERARREWSAGPAGRHPWPLPGRSWSPEDGVVVGPVSDIKSGVAGGGPARPTGPLSRG